MRRPKSVLTALTACGLAVGVGFAAGPATASAAGPSVTVIASHLSNPRGMSVDGGKLYLAEAGRYQRPIVSRRYDEPIHLFDGHTYDKGGRVLHMVRQ